MDLFFEDVSEVVFEAKSVESLRVFIAEYDLSKLIPI